MEENVKELQFKSDEIINGRFRLKRFLGRGGVGCVWVAQQTGELQFSREVAIKFFQPEILSAESFMGQSIQEQIRISCTFQHNNIVSTRESGTYNLVDHNGIYFIVMDFINGPSLAHVNHHLNMVDEKVVLSWAMSLIKGLQYLHSQPNPNTISTCPQLVHGDVSAQNVLLELDTGRVVLSDFGVQSCFEMGRVQPDPVVFGNTWYMPPEQAYGEKLTPESDVYSLGILLFELLLGRRSELDMYSEVEILEFAKEGRTFPRNEFGKLNNTELETILIRATNIPSNERYSNIGEMRSDLEKYISKKYGFIDLEEVSRSFCQDYMARFPDQAPNQRILPKTNKTSLHRASPRPGSTPERSDPSGAPKSSEIRVEELSSRRRDGANLAINGTLDLRRERPQNFGQELSLNTNKGSLTGIASSQSGVLTPWKVILLLVGIVCVMALLFTGIFVYLMRTYFVAQPPVQNSAVSSASSLPNPSPTSSEPPVALATRSADNPAPASTASNPNGPANNAQTTPPSAQSNGEKKTKATLTINALPYAYITLKNTLIVKQLTPLRSLAVGAGKFQVTAEKDECHLEQEITVGENEEKTIVFDMKNCR